MEQNRHATRSPEDYYLEGLRRDSTDIRLNNAYGRLLLVRGQFRESEAYFRAAVNKATRSNPNPYDSEPYYNLGLALLYQGRLSESYDALSDEEKARFLYQNAQVFYGFESLTPCPNIPHMLD